MAPLGMGRHSPITTLIKLQDYNRDHTTRTTTHSDTNLAIPVPTQVVRFQSQQHREPHPPRKSLCQGQNKCLKMYEKQSRRTALFEELHF